MKKWCSTEIEIAIANHFGYRQNLFVPNVYWGMGLNFECDLLMVSGSGYATEFEIKVSRSDIKRDLSKHPRAHHSQLIKFFYYAVPESLADCEHLPVDAGLIVVRDFGGVKVVRPARVNKTARKLTEKEISNIMRLGCMRIWTLKQGMETLKRKFKPEGK